MISPQAIGSGIPEMKVENMLLKIIITFHFPTDNSAWRDPEGIFDAADIDLKNGWIDTCVGQWNANWQGGKNFITNRKKKVYLHFTGSLCTHCFSCCQYSEPICPLL
jgi:hypothetical protein